MADEPHEVVKLLLARMESHPEEFRVADGSFHNRWYDSINGIHAYGDEADKTAIAVKLRDIRMGEIHEQVMDELLNGPDKRRKEAEENEYERNLSKSVLLTKQQMQQQTLGGLQNAYANAFANQAGAYDFDLDMYRNAAVTGIVGEGSSLKAGRTVRISNGGTGATTLSSIINELKQMTGAKK